MRHFFLSIKVQIKQRYSNQHEENCLNIPFTLLNHFICLCHKFVFVNYLGYSIHMSTLSGIPPFKPLRMEISESVIFGFFIDNLDINKGSPDIFCTHKDNRFQFYAIFVKGDILEYERSIVNISETQMVYLDCQTKNKLEIYKNEIAKNSMNRWDYEPYCYVDSIINETFKNKSFKLEPDFQTALLYKRDWSYANLCKWFYAAFELTGEESNIKFFRNAYNILQFSAIADRIRFLQLHRGIPYNWRNHFKSTKDAYRKMRDFYKNGKKNTFGYTVLAQDGHSCNSLAEAVIDDFMFENKMSHEKEPSYPGEAKWRADFKYKDYYIEYFGLKGQLNYDQKTDKKRIYAKENNMKLIEIFPEDIQNKKYKTKLLELRDSN
jgi:hypothetical protein